MEKCVANLSGKNLAEEDAHLALRLVVGTANLPRWQHLKGFLGCPGDENLATILLDLAQKHFTSDGLNQNFPSPPTSEEQNAPEPSPILEDQSPTPPPPKLNKKCNKQTKRSIKQENNILTNVENNFEENLVKVPLQDEHSICKETGTVQEKENKNRVSRKKSKAKKTVEYDVRKAPELTEQLDGKEVDVVIKKEPESPRLAIKIKMCFGCDTRHVQDQCPLQKPVKHVEDSINLENWIKRYKNDQDQEEEQDAQSVSFAILSLPQILSLADSGTSHGFSVFANVDIKQFTQFGPLVGKLVKEVDIPEDFNMRDLWEIYSDDVHQFVSTEDVEESNWMRWVRPADTRESRNVTAICKNDQLFLVTVKTIEAGGELLYWQDDVVAVNKKKMEKTTCGGCNMTFSHPLYYRTHCSIFHDVRYSLTIRKYHCKICGAAVLGKENIMKHAAELHNGQGAYQCQFCKKFFLRLNYLEMHRTYGCSANPHRSRPLCDFCGRKFCQPQKLKVHIKRMHSDLAEVLKEFQCKNCMKLLGSRAALQRHMKEVHHKQVEGACACTRCGKLFQNKSNLKIHMLTHSGIKPFKCAEGGCAAAFTTKQCLQFHYKKVHGFSDDVMPEIKRSVDYTFEAYSGVDDQEQQDYENGGEDMDTDFKYGSNGSEEENSVDQEEKLQDAKEDSCKELIAPTITPPPTAVAEPFSSNATMKILSKGSKKWLGEETLIKPDVYELESNKNELPLDVDERSKLNLNVYRHESNNASLLVEAALDSVTDIHCPDINVDETPNDTLNLCSIPDYPESRDINLISPSVNEQISVTDDLRYSNFHNDDFSPAPSPGINRTNFPREYIDVVSPHQTYNNSPASSPPRYNFNEHASSDDSNGLGVQNLSLHPKQPDLSMCKTGYGFDRMKLNLEPDRKQVYILEINQESVNEDLVVDDRVGSLVDNICDLEGDIKQHKSFDFRKYSDLSTDVRSKFDLDLNLRPKYDLGEVLRPRTSYDNLDPDFRIKSYEENVEIRTGLMDTEFRIDRNFEPLVLNTELQGLDMSARSYHNFHPTSNLNRYHHLYPDVDRDLRLNYSPPPPSYTHADVLRVVSLDLTSPGRHSVDLSLRPNPLHVHQLGNTRLLGEHTIPSSNHRLLLSPISSEMPSNRHLSSTNNRLLHPTDPNRILSDHSTNRILSSLSNNLAGSEETRVIPSSISPTPYPPYSVSPVPYHPTALPARPHGTTTPPYHHYSTYY